MQIKPYSKNAKKHPKKQIEQIANSIKEFGMNQKIIVDKEGVIIVGHGRWESVKSLGWTDEEIMKYVEVLDIPKSKANAYRLADNKLNESDWDMELVIEELKNLTPEEIDLTGFEKDLIIEADEKDDEVPEIPEEPKSKLGDLYELGQHRVLCGDSTKIEDFEKLMNGEKADMVFTSPPYNGNTKSSQGSMFNGKPSIKLYADGYSDNLESSEYVKFARDVLSMCFSYTEGFIFWNVNYNQNSRYEYIKQIEPFLEFLREQICWKKSSAMPFKGSLQRQWEPIYLFSTMKASLGVDKVTSNFWDISNTDSQQENHKACYPVELVVKGIDLVSNSKTLLDPFLGSGTTLIAAEKTGRMCYGMELDPKYIDVIIQRYVDYTGNENIKLNGEDIIWKKTQKNQ